VVVDGQEREAVMSARTTGLRAAAGGAVVTAMIIGVVVLLRPPPADRVVAPQVVAEEPVDAGWQVELAAVADRHASLEARIESLHSRSWDARIRTIVIHERTAQGSEADTAPASSARRSIAEQRKRVLLLSDEVQRLRQVLHVLLKDAASRGAALAAGPRDQAVLAALVAAYDSIEAAPEFVDLPRAVERVEASRIEAEAAYERLREIDPDAV
jgi:hypothetical protein